MKIGVVVNRLRLSARDVLTQLLQLSKEYANLQLLFEKHTGALIHQPGLSELELAKKSDLLLVAGGDGSLLDVVEAVFPSPTPILGVNLGNLGFLTAVAETEVATILPYLAKNNLRLSPRLALETRFHHSNGRSHLIPCALNDVVISRANVGRLVRIRVEVGDYLVTEYVCDGLIVATPTGSTAYSLAAGGPIISPDAESIVLTPISPHTLTNRALVVGAEETLRIRLVKQYGVAAPSVQFDGRPGGHLRANEWIEIKPAPSKVPLAYLPQSDFYHVLRQKLKWSGSSL
ncbi:MAG: NAD(+)/NADH kinase [Methylacidiphilales bacterium]|nr:NAD(+)/NADH kinase [Candidatus Methylacidiphilales bacterium]